MENNKNNWNNKNINLAELFNFRTKSKYKYPLLLLISTIPMLILIFTFGNAQEYSDGFIWGLSMGVFVFDFIIIFLLQKFTKSINVDMFSTTFSSTWFWISWYGLYMIGLWNIIVSLIFAFVFYFVGVLLGIFILLVQQKNKADSFLKDLGNFANGNNQNPFENSSPFTRSNEADILKNLDEELKKQGIDIDKLDETFGSFLNKDKVVLDDILMSDFNSEDEIIEALTKKNNQNSSEYDQVIIEVDKNQVENNDEDLEIENDDRKIIDQ